MKQNMYQKVNVIAYKHDGSFHRAWENYILIEESNDWLVTYGKKGTLVTEISARKWHTRENNITYFSKHTWINVVVMDKLDGLHYYVNLASPAIIDEEGIKYIDYDLDIKIIPSKRMSILDQKEFIASTKTLGYPSEVVNHIWQQIDLVKKMVKQQVMPFCDKTNMIKFKELSDL